MPFNQSRGGASFIGGGQVGYNWQAGSIVYGLEGDVQVMRNRDTVSASFLEFTPGLLPSANIARNTFATYFIDRQWQATLRGRFGYAWDRLLIYATGGLAVTSLKTGGNYTFQTILGPALAPFPAAPPQNFSAPGLGSSQDYIGVTFGGGIEYAFSNNWSLAGEYRVADFGKQNLPSYGARRGRAAPRNSGRNDGAAALAPGDGAAELSLRWARDGDALGRARPGADQLDRLLCRRLRGRRLGPRPGGYVRSLDQPAGVRPAAAAADQLLRLGAASSARPAPTATLAPAASAAARSAATGRPAPRRSSSASKAKPA